MCRQTVAEPSNWGLALKYVNMEKSEVEPTSEFYYTCTAVPPGFYVSSRSETQYPQHLRKMTQCALMDGNHAAKSSAPDGFVKSDNKFIIDDKLEIFPSSKSLVLLQKLKVENMSILDSLDICVGTEEEASLGDSHHRERMLHSAFREIDRTCQAGLARCVGDRDLQSRDKDFTNRRPRGCSLEVSSRMNEELEKKVTDNVVDKLCRLAICGPPVC